MTVEIDAGGGVPPSLYAKIIHCKPDWTPSDNIFISDIATSRTTNIEWYSSASSSKLFRWRGRLKVPNEQLKFKYSGNWKISFYDLYGDESAPLAEARVFVVEPWVSVRMNLYTQMYDAAFRVSSTAFSVEALASTERSILETQLNTAVFYRNHRWFEPIVITQNSSLKTYDSLYRYPIEGSVSGFSGVEKRFIATPVPAENVYRQLDLTDLGYWPRTETPIRMPFSDLRRNGSYLQDDYDGAIITRNVYGSMDDYVPVEFALDPEGRPSRDDVFILGSFNGWQPSPRWQMYYDAEQRLYSLRQYVRRGLHGYLYATGKYNVDTQRFEKYSTDEFEGNTAYSNHTYICFIYYRELVAGGFDRLVGVGAGNTFGNMIR
ncbi:MAG: type IX secretion system plug protein domain-containing protein [Chloroflexota bacterium]